MNDLFSSSFKKYTDLKQQAYLDDMEAGRETVNLDKFFEDVESVKEEMKGVEKLYKKLQEANEESKIVHNAKTMKELRSRMDMDVEQVLKKVKVVKAKLEALDRSNVASRNVAGCGPGSSADRTRTSVVGGLGKKLKDMMDDFQNFRNRMTAEYKETVERRYFTITGQKADEDTIENLISSGESESFLSFIRFSWTWQLWWRLKVTNSMTLRVMFYMQIHLSGEGQSSFRKLKNIRIAQESGHALLYLLVLFWLLSFCFQS